MAGSGTDGGCIGCLKDYTPDCKYKELKSFAAAHPGAFLVHHGPIGALKEPVKKKTLAVKGRGQPTAVKSLSRLRFGTVVMTFMLAPDFYKLAREFF